MISYQDQIIEHYQTIWDNIGSFYLWEKGPIEKLPHDFRVLEFPSNERRKIWTYATCCMSMIEDKEPIELHLFSLIKDESIIELLTSIVYYHRVTARIKLNDTVDFGRAWQDDSLCHYGLISKPYLDGPGLEVLNIHGSNKVVKFYWLIPITENEMKFKIKNGLEALEEKFDLGLNYVDATRKSLV